MWHVCDYDGATDTFKTINTMSYESKVEDVGMLTTEVKKSRADAVLKDIQKYYSLLESDTGEDVKTKISDFQTRLQGISDDDDISAADALLTEVQSYYNTLAAVSDGKFWREEENLCGEGGCNAGTFRSG